MARKLRPHEKRAFFKAAQQVEPTFPKEGCSARRQESFPGEPIDGSNNAELCGGTPGLDESSWPDEWGW
jgi:hypothetical protein